MKFFRYRRPSLKTVLGITRAKKRIKKDLGITALLKPFRWWPNEKRKIKREIGYESEAGRLVRDGLPKAGGCLVVIVAALGMILIAGHLLLAADDSGHHLVSLERSFWLHASLAPSAQKGYWGPEFPDCSPPSEQDIRNAVSQLTGPYAANRLYLVYHHEMPLEAVERVFMLWHRHCPGGVQIVPTLLLRMYDKGKSEVFTPDEIRRLVEFSKRAISPDKFAVFDVYANRDQGEALKYLGDQYPKGLIRLGIQPDEKLRPPFVEAVQDTWSGFCHGKTNADWQDRGFGADTLRQWVRDRNQGAGKFVWDLIAVAWDYSTTERGAYPGYDDATKNMPLPEKRNSLAADEILRTAQVGRLGGFSSDLLILQVNSENQAHDGRSASFYETLKRGETYQGYYSKPLQEIGVVFRRLKDGKRPVED